MQSRLKEISDELRQVAELAPDKAKVILIWEEADGGHVAFLCSNTEELEGFLEYVKNVRVHH